MRGFRPGRRVVVLSSLAMVIASAVPGPGSAAPPRAADIRACARGSSGPTIGGQPSRPMSGDASAPGWTPRIDAAGSLRGYTLRLASGATWRAGPRAFMEGPFGDHIVTGTRSQRGTRIRIIDLARGCVERSMSVRSLVYGTLLQEDRSLMVSLVRPSDRAELGVWWLPATGDHQPRRVIAPPSGAIATATPRDVSLRRSPLGVLARWCAGGACVERGRNPLATSLGSLVDLDPDAINGETANLPIRSPRPVPVYDRWFPWSVLWYKFSTTDVSPSWMRDAIQEAADDATDTSKALSPIFTVATSGAQGLIRYTTSFPTSCATAIACASHDADQWTLRMRPQNTDFRWGTLRWCQKAVVDGCFDAERVALHEFGHVVGLDHPEVAGFRLAPAYTVMHQVTASRPHASWDRHSFGSCDVASLQEQYGTPTMSTLIASCNDVDSRVTLSASGTQVAAGGRVVLSAVLKVRTDDAAYGRLSGMRLNERTVKLRRRPAGSAAGWTTSWMRWAAAPGLYTITLYPRATYEYQAVFGAPDNEGLEGDTSDVLTIKVTGACSGMCPNEEDPT